VSSLERRLERLEAGIGAEQEAPWWGLPRRVVLWRPLSSYPDDAVLRTASRL
jgi:hypothetical protein